MRNYPEHILFELERAVQTTDRKLTNLYRKIGGGTVKTNKWDLREETPEELQSHVHERNTRAHLVACRSKVEKEDDNYSKIKILL